MDQIADLQRKIQAAAETADRLAQEEKQVIEEYNSSKAEINQEIDNYLRKHGFDPARYTLIKDASGNLKVAEVMGGIQPMGSIRPRNSEAIRHGFNN